MDRHDMQSEVEYLFRVFMEEEGKRGEERERNREREEKRRERQRKGEAEKWEERQK